jgi:hypothetical protein
VSEILHLCKIDPASIFDPALARARMLLYGARQITADSFLSSSSATTAVVREKPKLVSIPLIQQEPKRARIVAAPASSTSTRKVTDFFSRK